MLIMFSVGCSNAVEPFEGVCLGGTHPAGEECGAYNSYGSAVCNRQVGCSWMDTSAGGFCNGSYSGCTSHPDPDACAAALDCAWYSPDQCASRRECVAKWLQEDGGCAEVAGSTVTGVLEGRDPATGMYTFIMYDEYCP